MIYFEDLPLDKDILEALKELSINYVFQSIFYPDGKTIYAREALMRPTDMTVLELIDKYEKEDKLHVIEVATIFGAMQAYQLRGYTEKISINSFPSESFTDAEGNVFMDYYGDMSGVEIVEILEYPYFSEEVCRKKKAVCNRHNLDISIDDFGTGLNNMEVVDKYEPVYVKLDRTLISGIDHDYDKQLSVADILIKMHERGIKVVAEGVETKEEFDYLVEAGADFFQGFYLHRPE